MRLDASEIQNIFGENNIYIGGGMIWNVDCNSIYLFFVKVVIHFSAGFTFQLCVAYMGTSLGGAMEHRSRPEDINECVVGLDPWPLDPRFPIQIYQVLQATWNL